MDHQIKEHGYKVFFASSAYMSSIIDYSENIILITPDSKNSKWNDQGYRIRCRLTVRASSREELSTDILLGFIATSDDSPQDINLLDDLPKRELVPAEKLPEFFSMQPSMAAYRRLVDKLTSEELSKLLISVNDLVAMNHYRKNSSLYKTAISQRVFSLAFMRMADTFFAFHNAGEVLDGLVHESFNKISNTFKVDFKLDGFENNHQITLKFNPQSILPQRINILIGRNGLGKSQTLSRITDSLLKNNFQTFADAYNERPMINRVLAIATPGETSNTFPSERSRALIPYKRLDLSRRSRAYKLSDLFIRLVRNEEKIGEHYRLALFQDTVSKYIPLREIGFKLKRTQDIEYRHPAKNHINFEELFNGNELDRLHKWGSLQDWSQPVRIIDGKTYPLSSGQLVFLKFVAQAILFIENGTLVLIDEPETHLHPNLISDFVELLDEILKLTGSLAIIATHSAYFVREVTQDQVNVFKEEPSGHITVLKPYLKTFGANVGAISQFVFEDSIDNVLIDKLLRDIKGVEQLTDFIRDYSEFLSIESVINLKEKVRELYSEKN